VIVEQWLALHGLEPFGLRVAGDSTLCLGDGKFATWWFASATVLRCAALPIATTRPLSTPGPLYQDGRAEASVAKAWTLHLPALCQRSSHTPATLGSVTSLVLLWAAPNCRRPGSRLIRRSHILPATHSPRLGTTVSCPCLGPA
jgi:hypothetical protein